MIYSQKSIAFRLFSAVFRTPVRKEGICLFFVGRARGVVNCMLKMALKYPNANR